jgi:hypothetical protein
VQTVVLSNALLLLVFILFFSFPFLFGFFLGRRMLRALSLFTLKEQEEKCKTPFRSSFLPFALLISFSFLFFATERRAMGTPQVLLSYRSLCLPSFFRLLSPFPFSSFLLPHCSCTLLSAGRWRRQVPPDRVPLPLPGHVQQRAQGDAKRSAGEYCNLPSHEEGRLRPGPQKAGLQTPAQWKKVSGSSE